MGHQTQFSRLGEIETCGGIENIDTVGLFSTQGRHSLTNIRMKNKNAKLVWQIFYLEIKIGFYLK